MISFLITVSLIWQSSAFLDRRIRSIIGEPVQCKNQDCGDEVCITDFLEKNNAEGARKATEVFDLFPGDVKSYSGFARVNETAKNKLFFWYVPATEKPTNNESTPLLIWLQGGPGGSSLFGMFTEMGPFKVESDGSTLTPRDTSWNKKHGMIFIDNPVGAGYSYTETETGYCTNTKVEVSSQLYELMQQFYAVFPEQLQNELIITGESYAGHYVPGLAYKIHQENANIEEERKLTGDRSIRGDRVIIPLTSLAIGDGWVDPYVQLGAYPDMLFNIGVSNLKEKEKFTEYVTLSQKAIAAGDMYDAFTIWDQMINGDIYPYPNYYHNVTGSNDYDNFMDTNEPAEIGFYYPFVTATGTRKAIHTGDAVYNNGEKCEMNLVNDFMVSFKDELSVLLESYKVLIYSGQLDVIIGAALTETMLPTIPWSGQEQFERTDKKVWRVNSADPEVAGYVQQFSRLTYAVVRGAGHLVPFDQPSRALDMIEKWVGNIPFVSMVDPA